MQPRFRSGFLRGTAVVAVVALSACGGGRSGTLAPAPAATAATLGAVQFALTIPNRIAPSSERRAQYISASTQSVEFVASPGAVTTKINLTGSICVPNAQSTAKICTFAANAPVGAVTFAMTAYDQLFDGMGNLPMGTLALSAASNFSVTVVEGQNTTTVPLIAGGIPAAMDLHFTSGTTALVVTGAGTTGVVANVYDADGNIIVAPGAFVNASGVATPITIASSASTAHFGYTVTPAATGIAGARSGTITLNEPDDTIALSFDGTGFVPASDALAHAAVPNHIGGGPSTALAIGWLLTPPFTATMMTPVSSAAAASIGHSGIFVNDSNSSVAFIGDHTSSCNVLQSGSSSFVAGIGGMTADANSTDYHLYLSVEDPSISGTGLDQLTMAGVAAGSCAVTSQTVPTQSASPLGIAAANGHLYGAMTAGPDFLYTVDVPADASAPTALVSSGTLFGTSSVAVAPGGGTGYLQFSSKKAVAGFATPANGTPTAVSYLAGMTDTYPHGVTVDPSGNVYANNSTAATYGTNGGVDVFGPALGAPNGQAHLNAPISISGPNGALQNMVVAPYASGTGLYVVAGDGIEVFSVPVTGSQTPVTTIVSPYGTPVSIILNGDGRLWTLLSTGKIEALPPQ